jgi:hypothetical protein
LKEAGAFRKSAAKIFAIVGVGQAIAHGPANKSFLLLFFKKEALSYLRF